MPRGKYYHFFYTHICLRLLDTREESISRGEKKTGVTFQGHGSRGGHSVDECSPFLRDIHIYIYIFMIIDSQSYQCHSFFFQYVEYYIDRGVLGVSKELSNTILEYRGAPVVPRSRIKWDSHQNIVVPVMPPTLLGVCRLIQIYYVLKVRILVLLLLSSIIITFRTSW